MLGAPRYLMVVFDAVKPLGSAGQAKHYLQAHYEVDAMCPMLLPTGAAASTNQRFELDANHAPLVHNCVRTQSPLHNKANHRANVATTNPYALRLSSGGHVRINIMTSSGNRLAARSEKPSHM